MKRDMLFLLVIAVGFVGTLAVLDYHAIMRLVSP